jgi:hypothetical protein
VPLARAEIALPFNLLIAVSAGAASGDLVFFVVAMLLSPAPLATK